MDNVRGFVSMYPSSVSYVELLRFRRLLGQKGKDRIEWNVWKYSYRKAKFQAITETFRFLGLTNSKSVLTSLGRRFVIGRDDKTLIVGLIQSEYFSLFQTLLGGAKPEENVFDCLSMECVTPTPERERRSMYNVFIDFSAHAGLLKIERRNVALTSSGKNEIERHSKIPLWAYDLPLFDESRRIERFKALYYETGHPFRDIVKDTFSELGFEAKNLSKKVQGIPDIEVNSGDFKAVVETKGENKQIGENDVNQLSKSQSNPEFKEKKLVFVGNAFRLKPPSERVSFFHENAVVLAESKGIILVGSLTLVNALQVKWKRRVIDLKTAVKSLSKSGLCSGLT